MVVKALFFGRFREITKRREQHVNLGESALLADLVDQLAVEYGDLFSRESGSRDSVNILINGRHYQTLGGERATLCQDDEVAFLQLMEGG
jgi:molybdopterin converting factor small subunit